MKRYLHDAIRHEGHEGHQAAPGHGFRSFEPIGCTPLLPSRSWRTFFAEMAPSALRVLRGEASMPVAAPLAGRSAGFTLLEVLVALAILSTGIMAAMQLFPAALRQTHAAAERVAAANLASSELSRLRVLDVQRNDFLSWLDRNTLESLDATGRAYALYDGWFTTVQRTGGTSDTYRVTFSVQMMDGRRETFVTYVTRR